MAGELLASRVGICIALAAMGRAQSLNSMSFPALADVGCFGEVYMLEDSASRTHGAVGVGGVPSGEVPAHAGP